MVLRGVVPGNRAPWQPWPLAVHHMHVARAGDAPPARPTARISFHQPQARARLLMCTQAVAAIGSSTLRLGPHTVS